MNQAIPTKLCIAILVFLSAMAAFTQDHKPLPFSADYTITKDGKETATGKMYLAWPKLRMDITDVPTGFGGSAIIDYVTHKTISVNPQSQTYTELSLDQQSETAKSATPMNIDASNPCAGHIKWTCKKLAPQTISGRSCNVWEIATDEMGLITTWIDTKLNFPIKTRTKLKTKDGYIQVYTNIHEGPPDPAVFHVPAGYKKTEPTPATKASTPKPS